MNTITTSTVTVQTTSTSIPSIPCWFGEAVILSQSLRRSGILTKMAEGRHFARRRFGQYEVIDFLAVLFGYAGIDPIVEGKFHDDGVLARGKI